LATYRAVVLEGSDVSVNALVDPRRDFDAGEVGVFLVEAALDCVLLQIDEIDIVGLSGQDHRAGGKAGKQPKGIELAIAEGIGGVVIADGVALDLVSDIQVGEEDLAVCEGTRACVTHTDLFALQLLHAGDSGVLAHYQLSG